jgi:hypothetical protein
MTGQAIESGRGRDATDHEGDKHPSKVLRNSGLSFVLFLTSLVYGMQSI